MEEIQTFETIHKLKLPSEYCYFLQFLGACELYFDEYDLGIEFYALDKILDFMSEALLTYEDLLFFPKILFIGSNTSNGDIIALVLSKSDEANLTIFSIEETYPKDWLTLENKFTSLPNFLSQLYQSFGENYSI